MPTNTGSGAVPRNVGLDFAGGKYIFFADDDDLLVDSALEELFNVAETFDADVVYTEKYFSCDEEPVPKNLDVATWSHAKSFVDEPTLETNDISERIKALLGINFHWAPWTKFVRRDLLVDNDLKFPATIVWEDIAWTFALLCTAKRFLRVPQPHYVHRDNENSMMLSDRTAEQNLIILSRSLPGTLRYIDEFMRKADCFQKDPALFLKILQVFAETILSDMEHFAKGFSTKMSYEILRREFSKAGGDCAELASYLFVKNRPVT